MNHVLKWKIFTIAVLGSCVLLGCQSAAEYYAATGKVRVYWKPTRQTITFQDQQVQIISMGTGGDKRIYKYCINRQVYVVTPDGGHEPATVENTPTAAQSGYIIF